MITRLIALLAASTLMLSSAQVLRAQEQVPPQIRNLEGDLNQLKPYSARQLGGTFVDLVKKLMTGNAGLAGHKDGAVVNNGYDLEKLQAVVSDLMSNAWDNQKIWYTDIRYRSQRYVPGSNGPELKPATFSGAVYFPPKAKQGRRRVPILIFCHGTELEKTNVASINNRGNETPFSMLAPFYGFATVVPDYPGMGADLAAYHPYCHGESLAISSLDMVQHVLAQMPADYEWNGQLFVSGYSEGGYAAMATLKMLETSPRYPRLSAAVVGAACLAGPFSMSESMRDVMIAPYQEAHFPFFLPYVCRGYKQVYGDAAFNLDQVFTPELNAYERNYDLESVTAGSVSGSTANEWFLGFKGLKAPGLDGCIPRRMMNPLWVEQNLARNPVTEASSPVLRELRENDLVPANPAESSWVPKAPVLLVHSKYDDAVPYENSVRAYEYFVGHGATVKFIAYDTDLDPVLYRKHLSHELVYVPATVEALFWMRGAVK